MPSQSFGSPSSNSIKVNSYTKHEKHIQQILAATFASTSVLAGLVAFYWFARMKRNSDISVPSIALGRTLSAVPRRLTLS